MNDFPNQQPQYIDVVKPKPHRFRVIMHSRVRKDLALVFVYYYRASHVA